MKKKLILLFFNCMTIVVCAQNIHFTFENARNTNDGVNDFYEADIYIASSTDLKLGSGQIYFTYNTAAFGENIHTIGSFEFLQPPGSILAEIYDFQAYKDFVVNDNTISRVAASFQQGVSSGTFTSNNVTTTAKHLFSIKIKYLDVNEEPMLTFEEDPIFLDQFYTACGSAAIGFPDCVNEPGIQLVEDSFDSSGAIIGGTLNITQHEFQTIKLLPNPVTDVFMLKGLKNEDATIAIYTMEGKLVLNSKNLNPQEAIEVSNLEAGMYFVLLTTAQTTKTIQFLKK